ncbi:MAG: hypothetical protein ACTHQE_06530 [Thermomicrobiales bacterium]
MDHPYPLERWPAGHRAALLVVVHMTTADDTDPSVPAPGLDYATTGFQHLLRTLADLDVSTTTAWGEGALASSPHLARLALEEDHDVIPAGAAAVELAARITGSPVSGAMTEVETGFTDLTWIVTNRGGDVPTVVGEGMVAIPTSPFWTDAAWFDPERPTPPSALLEAWSQGLQSVRSSGQLMTVIVHPHLSGRPGFLEAIARFLDEAIGAGDVWMPRGSDLAEWWRARTPRTDER